MKLCGIYKFTNFRNNKCYIGSALDINKRKYVHMRQLKLGIHHSILLQRAWNKYWGMCSFKFEIIELCEKEKLIEREQHWLNEFKSYDVNFGYNVNPTAGSNLGRKFSEEFKSKMRATITDERKAKMSAQFKGKVCGPRSEEVKNKIRVTLTGQKYSKERVTKMRNSLKNYWANKKNEIVITSVVN